MKTIFRFAALIGIVFLACPASADEEKWIELFDPKLSQWEVSREAPRR